MLLWLCSLLLLILLLLMLLELLYLCIAAFQYDRQDYYLYYDHCCFVVVIFYQCGGEWFYREPGQYSILCYIWRQVSCWLKLFGWFRCLHGLFENRVPQYSTLNSRILIITIPKWGTPIFGNSHMSAFEAQGVGFQPSQRPRSPRHRAQQSRTPDF